MSADVPLFQKTEMAERYGRTLGLHDFPVLVRTYFVTQTAIAAVPANATERKLLLAHRSQTLREAILAFLAEEALRRTAGNGRAGASPATGAAATEAVALQTEVGGS